jgi:hypothetical protein
MLFLIFFSFTFNIGTKIWILLNYQEYSDKMHLINNSPDLYKREIKLLNINYFIYLSALYGSLLFYPQVFFLSLTLILVRMFFKSKTTEQIKVLFTICTVLEIIILIFLVCT